MWPDEKSPFWPLARQVYLAAVMFGFFLFAYQNKMSAQDLILYMTAAGGFLGIDQLKRAVAPPAPPADK